MARTFIVSLRVTTEEGHPGKWDWPDLIGDECSLVSVTEETP